MMVVKKSTIHRDNQVVLAPVTLKIVNEANRRI